MFIFYFFEVKLILENIFSESLDKKILIYYLIFNERLNNEELINRKELIESKFIKFPILKFNEEKQMDVKQLKIFK